MTAVTHRCHCLSSVRAWRPPFSAELIKHHHNASVTVQAVRYPVQTYMFYLLTHLKKHQSELMVTEEAMIIVATSGMEQDIVVCRGISNERKAWRLLYVGRTFDWWAGETNFNAQLYSPPAANPACCHQFPFSQTNYSNMATARTQEWLLAISYQMQISRC